MGTQNFLSRLLISDQDSIAAFWTELDQNIKYFYQVLYDDSSSVHEVTVTRFQVQILGTLLKSWNKSRNILKQDKDKFRDVMPLLVDLFYSLSAKLESLVVVKDSEPLSAQFTVASQEDLELFESVGMVGIKIKRVTEAELENSYEELKLIQQRIASDLENLQQSDYPLPAGFSIAGIEMAELYDSVGMFIRMVD